MFRRFIFSAPKFAKGFAGVSLTAAAAGTAISDAELKSKPIWYQETVHRLEHVLKKLSLYSYIENHDLLEDACDILKRCENVNNCEISWRLGRALTEKAEMLSARDFENRILLFTEAIDNFHKAFALEPQKGCSGAHKWYAIALNRLRECTTRHPYVKNAKKAIVEHLEKAVKIDPNDAIAWHLLGVQNYELGKYDEAWKNFQKVEELKKEFYPANMYYIGLILHKQKKKDEAISVLKNVLKAHAHSKFDRKAKATARALLYQSYNQTPEQVAPYPDY